MKPIYGGRYCFSDHPENDYCTHCTVLKVKEPNLDEESVSCGMNLSDKSEERMKRIEGIFF